MSTEIQISTRLAAAGCALMGLWFGLLVPLHPNILKGHIAQDVLGDGLWETTHTLMFFVGIAGVFAAAGIVAMHERRFGRLGSLVLVATVITAFATSGAGVVEASTFPLLARQSADLLAFDGPVMGDPLFRLMTGPWLFFPLCFAALGVLAYRDGAHRNAGLALAIGGVLFFGPAMWFVPVIGEVSCVVFGAALLWWAALLWRLSPAGAADPGRSPGARAESLQP